MAGTMVAMTAGFNLPLALASFTTTEPAALATGVGLSLFLGKQTMTKPVSGETLDAEHQGLVMTTNTNRLTRLSMALVHAYSAYKLAASKGANYQITKDAFRLLVTLAVSFAGVVWATSGYYGQ